MRNEHLYPIAIGALAIAGLLQLGWPASTSAQSQPEIDARRAPVLDVDGLRFKDLNKNGELDRYEDWRLPVEERVDDLVYRMTLEEKAGLMIHSSLNGFTGPNGEVLDATQPGGGFGRGRGGGSGGPGNRAIDGRNDPYNTPGMDSPTPSELLLNRNVRWILVRPAGDQTPAVTAKFHNGIQEIAEGSRLGIPVVFSSDPRHGVGRGGGGGERPSISQWPGQLGLAAVGDPGVTREFGRIAAQELRALGIQCTLSPMADVATEPRWNRVSGTFGEDANLVATLVKAYVEGFQGDHLSNQSVMTVTKHWPGDGPTKDGLDPHNSYGKWTIYPGGNFDYHLIPFQASFAAGTGGIMGGYFIPVGHDTVGINFSKKMLDGLLRDEMGFDGLVVTDWLRNMPWGVENLSEKDRQKTMVLAGIDQIGGDNDPKYIIENFRDGSIPLGRLDVTARRVLKPMFELGMFEDPYVDPDQTARTVASDEFLEAGYMAQVKSVVLLKNEGGVLPASGKPRVYAENLDEEAIAPYAELVDDPGAAQLAIIKVSTPSASYPYGGGFGGGRGGGGDQPEGRLGTLTYTGASNEAELAAIKRLAATGTPTVVVVAMDRPTILTEFIDEVDGVVASFSVSDAAVMDIVFGKYSPTGKLPFDLPSDMPSVMANAADVPFDMGDPLFHYGFGLTYGE